jgi:outer membrane lipoprotein SlyB
MLARRVCVAVVLPVFVAGCAGTGQQYRPIVDARNIDYNKYEADLKDCQQYASQTAGAAQTAAIGAGIGAVLGAVLAAAAGSRYDRAATARVGAVSGAVGGGAQGETDQRNIIRRCMSGRGYSVLQ